MTATIEARMRESYLEVWRALSRATGAELREKDGLLTYFSGAPSPAFNPTIVVEPLRDPAGALDACEKAFDDHGIAFGFEIPEGLDPATEEAARARGMTIHHTSPAMTLHPIPTFDTPAVDIREIDAATLDEHLRVQSAGFGEDLSILRTFSPAAILNASRFFLASIDGAAAATSIMCVTGREVGIFGVSTHPSARRRGLGRAVTAAAVAAGADMGADMAYLHATPMGFPVYEAMGFTTTGNYLIYTRPVVSIAPPPPLAQP